MAPVEATCPSRTALMGDNTSKVENKMPNHFVAMIFPSYLCIRPSLGQMT
jgi:hypothetical protein